MPVSYTHLEAESSPEPTTPAALEDSQIEQVLSEMELGVEDYLSLSGAVRDVAKTAETVSYTHLDVYKRQLKDSGTCQSPHLYQ